MEAVFPLFFCRIIIVFRGMDEVQLDKVEGEGSSERQGEAEEKKTTSRGKCRATLKPQAASRKKFKRNLTRASSFLLPLISASNF